MPFTYDLKTDIRFMQGLAVGKASVRQKKEGLSNVEVARIVMLQVVFALGDIIRVLKLNEDEVAELTAQIGNGSFQPKKYKL
ncbi:MAG: hypothetical protein ABIX01_06550 [Chitinophagaceae bacterium]